MCVTLPRVQLWITVLNSYRPLRYLHEEKLLEFKAFGFVSSQLDFKILSCSSVVVAYAIWLGLIQG